jgi:hypothetical protein
MEDLIVVTGYGQFAGHEVNASGEAVKLLPDDVKIEDKKYKIVKIHLSVEYEEVDRAVLEIWKMRPRLVVHCGKPVKLESIKNHSNSTSKLLFICSRRSRHSQQDQVGEMRLQSILPQRLQGKPSP